MKVGDKVIVTRWGSDSGTVTRIDGNDIYVKYDPPISFEDQLTREDVKEVEQP